MSSETKSATDEIIQRALKEEEAAKRLKKQAKNSEAKVEKVAKKGKTLEQIENEEGGPIKESMVGMAHNKRAAKRKGAAADTDLVADVEAVEEELEQEEEDGMKLEAFNLKEERRRGYFDEAGNYVEKEGKDDDDVDDAWLKSEEAKVVSAEVRKKIQEQQQRMQTADEAAPLSATQIARLQWKVAQLLLPQETVTRGLRRLGGHSRTARPQKRGRQQEAPPAETGGGEAGAGAAPPAQDAAKIKAQFEELTEAASTLMDAGETDVYGQAKEYFERAAAVYIDMPGPSNMFDAGPSKAAYEDADEDMFASDDEGSKQQQPQQPAPAGADKTTAATAASPAGATPPSAPPPAAPAADTTDYASWPIKELRRFLTERGQDAAGAVDKGDLVAKVKEVAAAEASASAASQAPPGYAFDPASGYWYSQEAGLFWDPGTGGFFNSQSGKWYSYDSQQQQFVEWAQQ